MEKCPRKSAAGRRSAEGAGVGGQTVSVVLSRKQEQSLTQSKSCEGERIQQEASRCAGDRC